MNIYTFVFSDGASAEMVSKSAVDPAPEPVDEPLDSWLVEEGDGQTPAIVAHDEFFEDRDTPLKQTNEVHPFRPVDPEGFLGFLLSWVSFVIGFRLGFVERNKVRAFRPTGTVIDQVVNRINELVSFRVRPSGKIICRIDRIYEWMQWIIDLIGLRNAYNFVHPGNGYCDTDPADAQPDGSTEIKLMCATTGGGILKVIGSMLQGGVLYYIVETFDYYNRPTKRTDGVWRVGGKVYSWLTHPYLFTARVNRVVVKVITWLTRNGIMAANDGGAVGGAGWENWPIIANKMAAIRASKTILFPALPCKVVVYGKSVIVDGEIVERTGGIEMAVDAYRFRGAEIYIRNKNKREWFKASEMLPQTQEPIPGRAFDYRCFVTLPGSKYPWRGPFGYSVPVCTWTRT